MPVDAAELERILAPVLKRIKDLEVQEPGQGVLIPPLHAPTHEPGGTDPITILPLHALTHEPGGSDVLAIDAAAAIGSLRTIGTGALQAGAGDLAPTSDQKAALVGTDGTPSASNEYVTNSDPRLVAPTPIFYNVKDYGALGDGATNDTVAIQAALDALEVTGGTLVFPAGTYITNTAGGILTLTLNAVAGLGYAIWGIGGATLEADLSMETVLLCIGGATNTLVIRDLSITRVGATTTNVNFHGLQISPPSNGVPGFTGVLLENVHCSGHEGWGILTLNLFNMQIVNCSGIGNLVGGLGIGSGGSVVVSGGRYNDNISSDGASDYGIAFYTGSAAFPTPTMGALVTGVEANGNGRKGIDVHHGRGIKIIGNTCIGNGSASVTPAGIYAVGEDATKDVRDIMIAYNYIDMDGAVTSGQGCGIQVGCFTNTSADPGDFIIIGNTIKNCDFSSTGIGILVNNATAGIPPNRVVIADNVLYNAAGSSHGSIHFDNNSVEVIQAIITNNIIRCPNAVNAGIVGRADNLIITDNLLQFDSTSAAGISAAGGVCVMTGNRISGTAPTTPYASAAGGVMHSNILTTGVVQFEPVVGAIENDIKVVRGEATIQIASGTRAVNSGVSFGYTFSAAPKIFLTCQSGTLIAGELPISATVQSPTTTGFSCRLDAFANVAANRDIPVYWLAVGT